MIGAKHEVSLFVFNPLVTAKSSRSGFLFRSVGQYVGVPVDNILRLLFLMHFSRILPRGVVFLDPHSVCLSCSLPLRCTCPVGPGSILPTLFCVAEAHILLTTGRSCC